MKAVVEKTFRALVHGTTVLLAFVIGLSLLYIFEKQPSHMPFVANCIILLALVIFAATRKISLSFYSAIGFALLVCAVSTIKYRMKGFDLHVFDFFFTGKDTAASHFLVAEYAYLIAPLAAAVVAGLAILALIALMEPKRKTQLAHRLVPLLAAAIALPLTYPLNAAEPRYFHYLGGYNASAFFISLLDLQYLSRETELAHRLNQLPQQKAFSGEVNCGTLEERPDVFFVLNESQTNPGYFPQLHTGEAFKDLYRSQDGVNRELQVETFGGGTWVTNLSVLTGLSSADFGAQSPYLTILLEGRVRDSIPQLLSRCGYRTVAIVPMDSSFVNEGPFLESIGIETVLDYDAIGATQYIHRDSFYFAAAEKLIAEHRRSDGRPLFLAMQTMFPHSPYVEELTRDMAPDDMKLADKPELDEYLRRLLISRRDFNAFLRERERAPGERGTLVLDFGDHQSFATKHLVDEQTGRQSLADLRSMAYKTYFSMHAFGYESNEAGTQLDALDVGFLGASFLEWGRLPMTPMFRSLLDVRDRCQGRFHDCADRAAVDLHLRRRIDSGLLEIF